MNHTAQRPVAWLAVRSLAATLSLAATITHAAGSTPPGATTYQAECGSCHTAYPSRFLKPADWGRVLATLDGHYGTDATLDAAALDAIARHLGASAQSARATSATTLPRITRNPWFLEEHDEIPAAKFKSPAVSSAANCSACHTGAERGDFDERSVRIPK